MFSSGLLPNKKIRTLAFTCAFIVILGTWFVAEALANGTPPRSPDTASKNDPVPVATVLGPASFEAVSPDPSSKNSPDHKIVEEFSGVTKSLPPDPSSKNYAGDAQSSQTKLDNFITSLSANGQLIFCGSSGNLDWETTSNSFQVIRSCTIVAPQNGWLYISANSSLGLKEDAYEAQFRIGIDSTSGDEDVDRWVNIYPDTGDGTDKSVALSVLKPVTAGTHTLYFLGKRYTGIGTVVLYDPDLTVSFIPSENSPVLICGASGDLEWSTTSNTFQEVLKCTMNVPENGSLFISADSSVGRKDGEYEAQFEIGIDDTNGDQNVDRWVNIYNDTGDGTDETQALSVLKSINPGMHTIYFLSKRYNGTGKVYLYDPTLSVIFIPSSSTSVYSCGESGNLNWQTTSDTFQVIRRCSLSVAKPLVIFIAADSSLARKDGEYEARFEVGIDNTFGDWNVDRWINIYNDTGDGTDKNVALSVLRGVPKGSHTFYFLGYRFEGSGTVTLYDPTITVLAIQGYQTSLPIIRK